MLHYLSELTCFNSINMGVSVAFRFKSSSNSHSLIALNFNLAAKTPYYQVRPNCVNNRSNLVSLIIFFTHLSKLFIIVTRSFNHVYHSFSSCPFKIHTIFINSKFLVGARSLMIRLTDFRFCFNYESNCVELSMRSLTNRRY